MTFEELAETTQALADAVCTELGETRNDVGFVLLTASNCEDGHCIVYATNLDRSTALYVASMAPEILDEVAPDSIGDVMGSA